MDQDEFESKIKSLDVLVAEGKKTSRYIALQAYFFIACGIFLAYTFKHLESENHYIEAIGLCGQIIAFGAAILLSGQFLDLPEKYNGVHNYALAVVMSAPIYLWMGSIIYPVISFPLGQEYSQLWMGICSFIAMILGLVLFGFGSIQEALSLRARDKSLVVYLGWYMVLLSLCIQIYLSLINLEVLSVPSFSSEHQ